VDGFADTNTAAVMKSNKAHASCSISCIAVYSHICCNIGTVIDVGCLSVWRICSACIMMVTSQHNRSDFSVSYHFIELQGNISSSQCILVKNTALSTNNQFILLSVADPDIVISVLTSSVRINNFHCSMVCLS